MNEAVDFPGLGKRRRGKGPRTRKQLLALRKKIPPVVPVKDRQERRERRA